VRCTRCTLRVGQGTIIVAGHSLYFKYVSTTYFDMLEGLFALTFIVSWLVVIRFGSRWKTHTSPCTGSWLFHSCNLNPIGLRVSKKAGHGTIIVAGHSHIKYLSTTFSATVPPCGFVVGRWVFGVGDVVWGLLGVGCRVEGVGCRV